jgi:hypothetical protein
MTNGRYLCNRRRLGVRKASLDRGWIDPGINRFAHDLTTLMHPSPDLHIVMWRSGLVRHVPYLANYGSCKAYLKPYS